MGFETISRLIWGSTSTASHSDMSTAPTTHHSPAPAKVPLSHGERGEPRDVGAGGHARSGIAISIDGGEPPPLPPRSSPHATGSLTYDDEAGGGRHCYCCHETQEELRDAQTRERDTVEQLKRDLEAQNKRSAKELADLRDALSLSQNKFEAAQVEREDIRRR